MEDMISRKAAIDALIACKGKDPFNRYEKQNIGLDWGIEALKQLPSAQPETHDKRTETHACDLISRQAAIDEIARWIGYLDDDMIGRIQLGLKRLPSAQPVITCDGCKFVGTYDTDFPCRNCIRREKDYYAKE